MSISILVLLLFFNSRQNNTEAQFLSHLLSSCDMNITGLLRMNHIFSFLAKRFNEFSYNVFLKKQNKTLHLLSCFRWSSARTARIRRRSFRTQKAHSISSLKWKKIPFFIYTSDILCLLYTVLATETSTLGSIINPSITPGKYTIDLVLNGHRHASYYIFYVTICVLVYCHQWKGKED